MSTRRNLLTGVVTSAAAIISAAGSWAEQVNHDAELIRVPTVCTGEQVCFDLWCSDITPCQQTPSKAHDAR